MSAKTSDLYSTGKVDGSGKIPERFENPECFKGYGQKQQHPLYATSNNTYGSLPPSVHTVPNQFHSKDGNFTKHQGQAGQFRYHGLNTTVDKSHVHATFDGTL